jgi:hypothetical protein
MSQTDSDIQFLARMVVATREGHQIPGADARRLNNLAQFGDSLPRAEHAVGDTTLPEERRAATQGFAPPETVRDTVVG